jgi:1-acyl-sn-glycerol-3-phosphate acyltransferase
MPASGAVLVCSNHQSVLDPVIVGLTFNRRLNYLARKTLFHFAPFRWLIEFLDAIPLDRDGLGMQGIKECLRRLRQGEAVLIFPEGTRTRDGNVSPLQTGFSMLARRGQVTVLPVGIDGAFDAWPRGARLPRLTNIYVCVGDPLRSEEIERLDDGQLVAEVQRRIGECFHAARQGRR